MDELEISGKRYISSRRAAKEYRYHPDYIGQLVRSKKVLGEKVGRTWYVESKSLAAYLSADSTGSTTLTTGSSPQEKEISAPKEEKVSEPEIKTYHIPIHASKDEEKQKSKGLVYITDESPFLPEIQKPTRQPDTSARNLEKQDSFPAVTRKAKRKEATSFYPRQALGVVLVGVLSLIISATVSSILVSTMSVGEEQAAGIEFSLP